LKKIKKPIPNKFCLVKQNTVNQTQIEFKNIQHDLG
jgi:hypothetical protein